MQSSGFIHSFIHSFFLSFFLSCRVRASSAPTKPREQRGYAKRPRATTRMRCGCSASWCSKWRIAALVALGESICQQTYEWRPRFCLVDRGASPRSLQLILSYSVCFPYTFCFSALSCLPVCVPGIRLRRVIAKLVHCCTQLQSKIRKRPNIT